MDVPDIATKEVDCPTGEAVGGGAGVSAPDAAELVESAPADFVGTGWLVTVRNVAPGQSLTMFAWAVCVTK